MTEYYNIDKIQKNSNFCPLPFAHVNVSVGGFFRPCCNTDYELFNREEKNISNFSLLDAFYSEEMKSIRKSFEKNVKHIACNVCWNNESKGVFSARKTYKQNFSLFNEPKISYIDVKFDNKCNLACKMCDPISSDQVWNTIEEFNKQNLTLPNYYKGWTNTAIQENRNRNYYTNLKKDQILDIITSINLDKKYTHPFCLKVTGGEPFISKDFLDLLDNIPKKYKDIINLKITTNGTKFTNKIFDKLKNFNTVAITISIDGTDKTYEYIRYPFKWYKVDTRIQELLSNIKYNKLSNFYINFSTLIQSYNVFNIGYVYQYVNYLNSIFKPNHLINICYDYNVRPAHINDASATVLPKILIKEAASIFCKQVNNKHLQKQMINFSKNYTEPKIERQHRFKQTLLNYDTIRKQNYKEVMPSVFVDWIENL